MSGAATPTTSRLLSDAAHRFCSDFARNVPLDVLVAHFSDTCQVFEHGLPRKFAPFIGSPFTGLDGVRQYFSSVAAFVTFEDMHFSDYIVDAEVRKVSVTGTAVFTWTVTSERWRETFTYVLDFDDQNKITRYQVWGDTASLYLASRGCLGKGPSTASSNAQTQVSDTLTL